MGVVHILQTQSQMIAARAGRPIQLVAVSARDRGKDRGADLSAYDWEDSTSMLAAHNDIDLLVEVMGGEGGAALEAVETALGQGRHVVTANKALMARHGTALARHAEQHHVALRFEAGVAGGIPIVKALTEGMAANRMTRILGVLNGTCNYILTEMERTGGAYADILAEAQRLGYAEADPTFDVGGFDAAQKLALLTATAFSTQVDYGGIAVEGIDRVTLTDIRYAGEMGYRIKLLGIAHRTDAGVEQRMQPCLVPSDSALGQLDSVSNMVVLEGDPIGRTVYQGPGAGAGATASAVVADIIDIARGLVIPAFGVPASTLGKPVRAEGAVPAPYYLRLSVADRPGTLARVADALGRAGISIDRMRQTQHVEAMAPVLIVTHACLRSDLDTALADIEALDVSAGAPVAYRIEPL